MPSLARNALWNVLAGMSAAVLGVLLPPFLTRILPQEEFGAWAFSLQVAGYINILNFGLQMVVGRLVADADARGDADLRDRAVSTAFAALALAALIGFLGVGWFAFNLDRFTPDATPAAQAGMVTAMLWLGASFVVQLPTSILLAVFVGMRQNQYFALATLASRLISFCSVVVVGYFSRSVGAMGAAWFCATVAGAALTWVMWRSRVPDPHLSATLVSRATAWLLFRESVSLTVWNIATLLTSGIQIILVARFDYAAMPQFAAISSITLLLVGFMQSVTSTIVPQAANMIALGRRAELDALIVKMSRISIYLLSTGSAVLIFGAYWILQIWLGEGYASSGATLLGVMALAHATRNLGVTYTMAIIGMGLQRRILLFPLVEGAVSFFLAYIWVQRYGALGVGFAMIVASLLGAGLMLLQNAARDLLPTFNALKFAVSGMLFPFAPALAAGACLALGYMDGLSLPVAGLSAAGIILTGAALALRPSDLILVKRLVLRR